MSKLLLYCTKAKPYITRGTSGKTYPSCVISDGIQEWHLNGKIVAECDFEVEEIKLIEIPEYAGSECNTFVYDVSLNFETKTLNENNLCKSSCLTSEQLNKYLDLFKEKEVYGYAIHIKNLHIFDEPKELSEFEYITSDNGMVLRAVLQQVSRNMQIIIANGTYVILISVSSQEMCRIANKEQTVLVRRNVLKEML